MRRIPLFIALLLFSTHIFLACGTKSNDIVNYGSLKPIQGDSSNRALKVVIDPGHGGRDVGATGASGRYEKDFNLSVSRKVVKLLEQEPGIDVFMTRTDDSFISQTSLYRPEYANQLNADLFISIHGNTFYDPNVSGTETFYYHTGSRLFANILQKHVVGATRFRDRGVKRKELFVLRETNMPAALVEIGYLTNPQDESKMWTDEFQNRVAASIVEAIKEYQTRIGKTGYRMAAH